MRPVKFSRTLVAGAVGAVCASQTPGGAGNLVINGTLAAGGIATLDVQRNIGINPGAGSLVGVNFTIFGTDQQGRAISEVIAGTNATVAVSVLNYLTVTRIAVSAAGVALTVDTVATGASQEIPLDRYPTDFLASIAVVLTGAVNYTVQYTLDDVYAGAPGPFTWFAVGSLTSQSANANASLTAPVSAIRLLTNSGTGTAVLTAQQAGLV